MAPLKTFFELSMKKDKDLKNLKIPVKGPKGTSKYMRMKVTNAPGASDIKKAVNSGFKTDANRKAAFAKMNDSTHSADKKPEKYIGPDGKTKIRMVPTDKEVVKKEASVLKPKSTMDIVKHARTLAKNPRDYMMNRKKYIDKARAKVFKMYPKEETVVEEADVTKGYMDHMKKVNKGEINKYPMRGKGKPLSQARKDAIFGKKKKDTETNEMIDPMDLRGRPKKKDPNPESPYGMKHPLHPMNIAKKKAKANVKQSNPDRYKPTFKEAVEYPHMMYDPKTGKEVEAKTPADHNKYAKMGYTHEKPNTDEALTMTQRMKKSRLMKRLKSRIKIGRDRARRKMAKKDTLEKRANRQARNQIASKLTRGIPKRELSFARKQEIEKRLDKPALKQRIKRLAKRLFKDVRKKEVQRKKG